MLPAFSREMLTLKTFCLFSEFAFYLVVYFIGLMYGNTNLSDIECPDYLPTWASKAGGGVTGMRPHRQISGDVPLEI